MDKLNVTEKLLLTRTKILYFEKKPFLNFKPQGTKKMKLVSQETDISQNSESETMVMADYKDVNISCFAVMDIKL